MTLKRKLFGLAAAVMVSGSAMAAPTFVSPIGAAYDPFTGIDWASTGTAWTTNFDSASAISGAAFAFDINYIAYAKGNSGLLGLGGLAFNIPDLLNGADGAAPSAGTDFEVTTYVTVNETAVCLGGGVLCTFTSNGGAFNIYLGTSSAAALDARAGTGAALAQYTNGDLLIGGTVDSCFTFACSGTFTASSGTSGIGIFSLNGTVTSTNNTYINPDLLGSLAVGTLQLGTSITSWVKPAFLGADTCSFGSPTGSCSVTFQADSNQDFTIEAVPEPGTLGLLALALMGAGAVGRRKKQLS